MKKFYFDTSIWRDYYENRSDKFRPLGEWALMLVNKIISEEHIVLYSDLVTTELKIHYTEEEIKKMFNVLHDDALVKVDITFSQSEEAIILSKKRNVPFGDALHSILARDYNAILVSRDNHFLELTDIAEIKKPEDLI